MEMMKMTQNNTRKQTVAKTAALSPMLMAAKLFWLDRVESLAMMARTKAGMMQERQMRYKPQQIIVMAESTRANVAKTLPSFTVLDAHVVVAAVG